MGTNYYVAREEPCGHCNEPNIVGNGEHIGKLSAGWRFGFHVGRIETKDGEIVLDSWKKWKRWIIDSSSQIIDEFRDPIPRAEFFALVESTRDGKNDRQNTFSDPDGWQFYAGVFS